MRVPTRKPGKYANEEQDRMMTKEKLESLRRTMQKILDIDLPQAAKDVNVAKEMGDLSENAAYTEAKARLRRLNGRVLSIKDRIAHAIIIEKGAASDGSIRVGATVTVQVNGKKKTYEILGSQETDPSSGKISHSSPLGSMLLGKKEGEQVVLSRDGRDIIYDILKVE